MHSQPRQLLRAAWFSQALLPSNQHLPDAAASCSGQAPHSTQTEPSGAPTLPSLMNEVHSTAMNHLWVNRPQASRHLDTHETFRNAGTRKGVCWVVSAPGSTRSPPHLPGLPIPLLRRQPEADVEPSLAPECKQELSLRCFIFTLDGCSLPRAWRTTGTLRQPLGL